MWEWIKWQIAPILLTLSFGSESAFVYRLKIVWLKISIKFINAIGIERCETTSNHYFCIWLGTKKKQRNEKPTITNNKTNQWISKKWWHRNYMSISLYGGMHGKCSASLWFINVCTFWHHFVVVVVRCQPVFPSKCYLLWIRSFESLARKFMAEKKISKRNL